MRIKDERFDDVLWSTTCHRGITFKGLPHNDILKRSVCLTADIKVRISQYPPSAYQTFLYKKIKELQNSGLGYRKIVKWFNGKGHQTPSGHQFKNTHVFSILKKRRLRDKKDRQAPDIEIRGVHMKIKITGSS